MGIIIKLFNSKGMLVVPHCVSIKETFTDIGGSVLTDQSLFRCNFKVGHHGAVPNHKTIFSKYSRFQNFN